MAAPDVRGRTVAQTTRGVAVEEVAFISDLKLGTYVALSYMDDPDVWHEALVTWPSLGFDRADAILTPDDDHFQLAHGWSECGASWIGICDSDGACDIVPHGSFCRFRSRPSGEQLLCVLEEGRRLLEVLKADGHWPLRGRYFLDAEGCQRSFQVTGNRVELAEEVGVAASRGETDRVEFPHSADTLWVLSDPLDDDFGRTVTLPVCRKMFQNGEVTEEMVCRVSQGDVCRAEGSNVARNSYLDRHLSPGLMLRSAQHGCAGVHGTAQPSSTAIR